MRFWHNVCKIKTEQPYRYAVKITILLKEFKAVKKILLPALLILLIAGNAFCDETSSAGTAIAPKIDTGDTSWLLISTALVMLMTPGLAFFYGGLVRRKNILSVLMQCLMILCLISLQWVLFGPF
jgi:Amt family ammonium transporter